MPSSHSIRSNRTIDGPNSPITDPRFNVRAKYHFVKKTENSIGTIETRPAISAKKSFLFVSRRHSFSWNASSMRLTKSTGRQLAFVGSWSRKLDEEQVPPPPVKTENGGGGAPWLDEERHRRRDADVVERHRLLSPTKRRACHVTTPLRGRLSCGVLIFTTSKQPRKSQKMEKKLKHELNWSDGDRTYSAPRPQSQPTFEDENKKKGIK